MSNKRPLDKATEGQEATAKRQRLTADKTTTVVGAGTDYAGQLGGVNTLTNFVQKHAKQDKIVGLAAGAAHSLALLRSGKIISFGSNDSGALGRPDPFSSSSSSLGWVEGFGLESKVTCVQIGCGDGHSVALDSQGRVWTWGSYLDPVLGPIGYNMDLEMSVEPRLITCSGLGEQRVVSISAGENHVLVRTASFAVYQWGAPLTPDPQQPMLESNKEVALKNAKQCLIPRCIPVVLDEHGMQRRAARISRSWATGKQCFVRIADHDPTHHETIWAWGLNNYRQLATDTSTQQHHPQNQNHLLETYVLQPVPCTALNRLLRATTTTTAAIEELKPWVVLQVVGGAHHAMALLARYDGESGAVVQTRVCSWGRIHYGRLGRVAVISNPSSNSQDSLAPADVLIQPLAGANDDDRVESLAASEAHSFALTEKGRLYGWGLDSSNQLGRPSHTSHDHDNDDDDDEVVNPTPVFQTHWPLQTLATAAQHTIALKC